MKEKEASELQPKYYMQWISTFGVFLLNLQIGFYIGWMSPNAARLKLPESPVQLDDSEISWLISIVTIGAAIGSLSGSICIEYIGSKKTLLMCFIFLCISWLLTIIAYSVEWLYVSRLIGGISCSLFYGCFALYLGEISETKIRGTLISTAAIGTPLGTVISTVSETYFPMKLTSSVYLVLCLIGVAIFLWLKDSPFFLARKGNSKSAQESIKFYRPGSCLEEKWKEIEEFVETSNQQSIMDKLREFKNPAVRKSMILVVIVFSLPHTSGYMVVMSYMQVIFEEAKVDFIKPAEGVIYINIIGVLTSVLVVNLIDKLGRRFILVFSSVGTITGIIALGVHFYLPDENKAQWLPIAAIFLYIITYSAGFNSLPSTILSEIFLEHLKSVAACFATLSISIIGFIVTKSYQPIVDNFGEPYAFWTFAVMCIIVFLFAFFLLPETKGKTFQEIQDQLLQR